MKYYEVNMTIEPCSQDAQDLLAALAGEAGFETFEETAEGLKGYVQQSLFDEETLKSLLDGFPIEFSSCPVCRHVMAVFVPYAAIISRPSHQPPVPAVFRRVLSSTDTDFSSYTVPSFPEVF